MKTLSQVQQQLAGGQFEFSRHAFHRAVERNIKIITIYQPDPNEWIEFRKRDSHV